MQETNDPSLRDETPVTAPPEETSADLSSRPEEPAPVEWAPPPQPPIPRRHDWIAVGILGALATLFFADVLFGVNNFYLRDLTRYYYPAKHALREIILSGEFPYWNRLFSAGQPMAANPEHEVFYPFTWLVLLPSYDLGYRLHILVHVYVALFGMYAMLRSMALRVPASFFGAVIWGLGGIFLSYINLLPIMFCAAWMPLTALYTRRFLIDRRARDFAIAAMFLGLQCLVGEPTTVMQTGFILGMYALYRSWYAPRRLRAVAANVGAVGLISIAAFAIGAAQMLPAADHAADSVRARGFNYELVSAWSMPWAKFGELIFPNILGHISIERVMWYWGGGLYKNMGSPFIFSIYSGLLLAALLVAAIFVRPRGSFLALSLAVFSFVIALGGHTPVLKWMFDAGLATSIRYPEKFSLIALFGMLVFGAVLFQRLLDGDEKLREAALGFALAITIVSTVIAVAGYTDYFGDVFMKAWGLKPGGGTKRMIAIAHKDWLISLARGAVLCVLLMTLKTLKQPLWLAAAAVFVLADIAPVVHQLNPRMPSHFFLEAPELEAQLPGNRHEYRVFHEADWYGTEQPARTYFSTGRAVYWVVRNGLLPMIPAGHGIATVLERDYDKTALLPTVDMVDSVWDLKRSGKSNWWEPYMAMSNARYRTMYRPFEAERKRTKGDMTKARPIQLLESKQYPRYYFADQMIPVKDRHEFVAKLRDSSFSERVAFVQKHQGFVPGSGTVRSWTETSNTAAIDVTADSRAFLVMSVTPHKYWNITLDGKRVEPVITNIGYQGIEVPEGNHRVEMRYSNPLVLTGVAVSGVVLLFLGGLALRKPSDGGTSADDARKRRHRNERIVAGVVVLILAGGVAWLVAQNEREEAELKKDTLYIPKPAKITPEVNLLAEYLRIDTSNPPGREKAGADWLVARLREAGATPEVIESAPGRPNVYARIKGKRSGSGLLLTNHIDVIPAEPKAWKKPPFAGEILLDSLYGRGAVDMKGTAICQLLAFTELARGGRTPEHDVAFLAVIDEETGGKAGMGWLVENRPDIFEGIRFALNEGGITEMNKESMTYFGIEIGTKLPTNVLLHAQSKEQLRSLRLALAPYFNARKPERISPEVRAFFRDLAPQRLLYRDELQDIDKAVANGKFWRLPVGYRDLTQDLVRADAIAPSQKGGFEMRVRMFNLPDTEPSDRVDWLRRFAAPYGATLEVLTSEPRAPLSPRDTPLFAILESEAKTLWQASGVGTEILNGSYNDSRYLRRKGISAYGVQPFPVDFFQSEAIHGVDERVRVEWFQQGVTYMQRVVSKYAFAAS